MPHHLNRTSARLLGLVLALSVLLCLAAGAAGAGHRRGFEPSEATLACVRAMETGGRVVGRADYAEPGANWDAADRSFAGYATAYQMDDDFARTYSAPIPDEHWALWGSSRDDPPWTWHPMLQDETARNGVRARGLQPWPPARRCPR